MSVNSVRNQDSADQETEYDTRDCEDSADLFTSVSDAFYVWLS